VGSSGTLRYPKYGQFCARVNWHEIYKNANSIIQQTVATLADTDPIDGKVHIRFAYAPVLENPQDHNPEEQPYIYFSVRNISQGNALLYERLIFSGEAGVPWKTVVDDPNLKYTDWQIIDIAPGTPDIMLGDTIELEAIAADCSRGGHFGYVYVDGFGHEIPGLNITKTASEESVEPGQSFTYTFTYRNGESTVVNNVVVEETIPDCANYESHTLPTTGGTISFSAGVVTCDIGTLSPGEWGTFTVTVTASMDWDNCLAVHNGNYTIEGTGVRPVLGPLVTTPINGPCSPQTSLTINTGWSQTQKEELPTGVTDGEWIVVSDPDTDTWEPRSSFVIPRYAYGWTPPQSESQWISSYATADDDENGHYYYEYRFCLEDTVGASVSMSVRADDQAVFYLNGNLIGSTSENSFKPGFPPETISQSGLFFLPGENRLRADVENIYSVAMGLNVVGTIEGNLPEYHFCCTDSASGILGSVWMDPDGDGVKDPAERGRHFSLVWLSNSETSRVSFTDVLGNYYFNDLPAGTYLVESAPEAGLTPTTPIQYTVTLYRGEIAHNVSFGSRKVLDPFPDRWEDISAICYPNPANPRATIAFSLADAGFVSLKIFDVSGKLVRRLANEEFPRGNHTRIWDGRDAAGQLVASGIYFYSLEANGKTLTDKIVMLK